jgi:hypothetical protein
VLDGTLGFPDNCINYEECWIEPLVSHTIVSTINPVGEEEECWIVPPWFPKLLYQLLIL